MIKLRTQNDGLSDKESLAPHNLTTTAGDEVITRQEFKDESDINWLLRHHSILPNTGQSPVYGVANFDDDLTTAYEAVQRAQDAYEALPAAARKLYPNWQSLAAEIARGDANPSLGEELTAKVTEAEKKAARAAKAAEAAEENPPTPAGSSSPAGGGGSPTEGRQK